VKYNRNYLIPNTYPVLLIEMYNSRSVLVSSMRFCESCFTATPEIIRVSACFLNIKTCLIWTDERDLLF